MKPMPSRLSSATRLAWGGVTRRRTYTNARFWRKRPASASCSFGGAVGQRRTQHRCRPRRVFDFTRDAVDRIARRRCTRARGRGDRGCLRAWRNIHRPSGLVLGACLKIVVAVHLQIQQPGLNADRPQHEDRSPDQKAGCESSRAICPSWARSRDLLQRSSRLPMPAADRAAPRAR